ncbi:hypothetical protein LJR047_003033 [Knoellia sp. LjRoot47]
MPSGLEFRDLGPVGEGHGRGALVQEVEVMGARWRAVWVAVAAVLVLAACAAAGNEDAGTATGQPGFWLGLWHGVISPITFIVSLFRDGVGIYEVRNSGAWYDFGFMLGVSFAFGSTGRAGAGSSRRRESSRAGRGDHG